MASKYFLFLFNFSNALDFFEFSRHPTLPQKSFLGFWGALKIFFSQPIELSTEVEQSRGNGRTAKNENFWGLKMSNLEGTQKRRRPH